MGQYVAPIRDMQFVLHELLNVEEKLKELPAHAETDADIINQVLEEGAKFTSEVLFPLNHSGDREGCHHDAAAKTARYEELVRLADEAVAALPGEANSHYRRAFALGRLSQTISIGKALAQGLAGKVRESLDETLELAPKHAEAHTALGVYHAEIVAKVGGMLAKLTYGATAVEAEKQLKQSLKLTPESPIAWVEYGNALLLLHGDKREDDVAEAYDKAANLNPRDAMEALDAAWAKAQLE